MKKVLALFLASVFCLTFAGCAGNDNSAKVSDTTAGASVTATTEIATTIAVNELPTNSKNCSIKISSLIVNGESVFDKIDFLVDSETFVYNITNVKTDNISVEVQTNYNDTEVDCSKTSDFSVGENTVVLSLKANNEVKYITLMVYKYDENGISALKAYKNASMLYWMSNDFFKYDSSDVYTPDDNNPLQKIKNYNNVVQKYFTENGQNAFEKENSLCIYKSGGKVYGQPPQMGRNSSYLNTGLLLQKTDGNKSIYSAKSYYYSTDKKMKLRQIILFY